ncbi:hypothetical protein B0H19DRAFT_1143386 [Mycena capillaripes]|nr:hypothetical protein B0H19DRAFT_1143386 [Mycena capillaripes]
MSLEVLGEDILLKVLAICDVYTALSVSILNKPLRRVALAKQLWLSLLHDLAFCNVLDLPPAEELQGSATSDLINLVKRFVLGPDTWLPGSSGATIHRQVTFNMGLDRSDVVDFVLLLGGRYVGLRTGEHFSIHELASGRSIWKHASPYGTENFSVDLLEGGTIVRVLLIPVRQNYGGQVLCVQEVDLTSGQCKEVFCSDIPTAAWERWTPSILGDFFIFALRPPSSPLELVFVLVNWRDEVCIVLYLHGRSFSTGRVVLTPTHLVLTHGAIGPPNQQLLAIMSFDSLVPYWNPLREFDFNNQLTPGKMSCAVYERLEYEGRPLCGITTHLSLAVFQSPLHRDSYKIVLYACENKKPQKVLMRLQPPMAEPRAVLLSYRFSPPMHPGEKCGWYWTSAVPAVPILLAPPISYASYCLQDTADGLTWSPEVLDVRCKRAGAVSGDMRTVLTQPREWACMLLSSSGAVIAVVNNCIMVAYYA